MIRRMMLLGALALPGCSVLPDRPYIETQRFPLAPARPAGLPRRGGREVLLIRDMRAAPGLDTRGLRSIRADGTLAIAPYAEWAALPAEAAEAALRDWLRGSGLFAAIAAPGSRLTHSLVLETELLTLEQDGPASARAAIAALLVVDSTLGANRVLGQIVARGAAPVPGAGSAAAASGMVAALGAALAALETELATLLPGLTTARR
ncbi:MAG: membrane integrity-associated transporter subunit PqiC [Rubritepida sp.]|nr:membrane integrity-associated transporter subunit PqiC [Rubritepida sp.]